MPLTSVAKYALLFRLIGSYRYEANQRLISKFSAYLTFATVDTYLNVPLYL